MRVEYSIFSSISVYFLLAIDLTSTDTITFDPCEEFFNYVCINKGIRQRKQKLERGKTGGTSKLLYNVNPPNEKTAYIMNMVEPLMIYRWIVEFNTFKGHHHWKPMMAKLEIAKKSAREEQVRMVQTDLAEINLQDIKRYANSLDLFIDVIASNKFGVMFENGKFHGIFNAMKKTLIETIQSAYFLDEDQSKQLQDLIDTSYAYFGWYEFSNVPRWEKAREIYNSVFFHMSQEYVSNNTNEWRKIIHICAIDASVRYLTNYIGAPHKFSSRFLFQTIMYQDKPSAFNYEREIYVSWRHLRVITNDTDADEFTFFAFTIGHELIHSIFGNHVLPFLNHKILEGKQCIEDHAWKFANYKRSYKINSTDPWISTVELDKKWNASNTFNEDYATFESLRAVTSYMISNNASNDNLKSFLELVAGTYCWHGPKSNTFDGYHSPRSFILDAAISQIPEFKQIYNCKPTNRMYIPDDEICNVLGIRDRDAVKEFNELSEVEKAKTNDCNWTLVLTLTHLLYLIWSFYYFG